MPFDFSALASGLETAEVRRAGETIFLKGETGDVLYILLEGEAEVRLGDIVLETISRGGILGEMAMLDDDEHIRSATAVARTNCRIAVLDRNRLLQLVGEQPALSLEIAKVTVRRLRATNFLTQHDAVTRLPNRSLFQESCRIAVLRAQRRQSSFGVLFLDLDDFRHVNESLGHAAGDQVLRETGSRLTSVMHELDVVARLGEDKFAVLLEDEASGPAMATMAEGILHRLSLPYSIDGRKIYLTANAGLSCYPQDGQDEQALIRNAESAMRVAREQGRNGFHFFSADLQVIARETINLRNHLREAIGRNELTLNFQPRVALPSRRIVAVEALLRWRHPELGMVPPSKFIPVAEQSGMIEEIGEWVLRAACRQQRAWLDGGLAPSRMAVNLSARQLRRTDMHHRIAAILGETGLPAAQLELEITESAVMEEPARTVHILKELRGMGIAIALDDFGTEYSSLGYLKRFPLDYMKIDQCFVRGLPEASDDMAITMAIITLGRNLGLKIVAEGIETEPQLEFLAAQQCDEGQGYLFSRPLAPDQLAPLLLQSNRAHAA